MKATITRTGGFAGITLRREVDLSRGQLEELRKWSDRLQPVIPDALSYEVTVSGETFTVSSGDAAPLLETLLRAE